MLNFLKEAYKEFKKVKWPDKQQTKTLTAYVIGVSFLVGIYVTGIDFLFQRVIGQIIN